LVEVLVVVALIAIISGISIPITRGMINRAEADSAMTAVTSALQVARNRAIAERRDFEIHFDPPDILRVARRPVPSGPAQTVSTTRLENGQRIERLEGMDDTPDEFGGTGDVNFTGELPVMFTSDGSLVDSAGDPVNGTIFFSVPGQVESARALTILGLTGLTRTWKWTGGGWAE
jgi:Tfp pilus assembly protein FimT